MSILERLTASGVRPVVLCGGPGGEREVSLASGENVHGALLEAGLDNDLLVVPAGDPELFLERLECGLAVMMLHGEFGEDGRAQAILERRAIPFTGSDSVACAKSMDKDGAKRLFAQEGVPTPRWIVAGDPEEAVAKIAEAGLCYPLFVKPNYGGSSVGARRARTPEALRDAVAQAAAEDGELAIIEEMVEGREFTVSWLDGQVLPIIELRVDGDFYDYRAKYLSDATGYVCPADVPGSVATEIGRHVEAVTAVLGVRDLSRVDIMLGADGPMVLELNALPGFTTHSLMPMAAAAAGIALDQLCLRLTVMAADRAGIA